MKGTIRRLGNYKIVEFIDGTLWWESYSSFARTQSGRCFVESNILFLAPAIDVSEPGFLIMEYNETLDILPRWTKTPYYCTNYMLRSCHNDKILSSEGVDKELKKRPGEAIAVTEGEQGDLGIGNEIKFDEAKTYGYKLGRYKIIESKSGDLRWKTCTHLNRLKSGRCFVQGKILFLNRKVVEERELPQKEFLNCLKQLPEWSKTPCYCTNYTLKPCQTTKASAENRYDRYLQDSFRSTKKKLNIDKKALNEKIYTTRSEIAAVILKYKHWYNERLKK